MTTLTVRLPEELKQELEKLCENENVPMSDVIRESIKRYIAIRHFRTLRGKTLPFAESQGLLTDEDIFRLLK